MNTERGGSKKRWAQKEVGPKKVGPKTYLDLYVVWALSNYLKLTMPMGNNGVLQSSLC
jgi:hypothetical protein